MTQKEMNLLSEGYEAINRELEKQFEPVKINGMNMFQHKNGLVIHPEIVRGLSAIVIEYAKTKEEAKRWEMEDGDLIDVEDMETPEDAVRMALKQIEEEAGDIRADDME